MLILKLSSTRYFVDLTANEVISSKKHRVMDKTMNSIVKFFRGQLLLHILVNFSFCPWHVEFNSVS